MEPFPCLQARQRETLAAFHHKIEWRRALQTFTGVHFSNELMDAMPVRLIAHERERLVGLDGDKFVFVERPVRKAIFNQAAIDWIDEIAANLQGGYVITIDYGLSDEESGRRVQVRSRHRNLDSPFEQIGEADITMHVDWKSIARRAEANGLRVAGFTDQHHFLTGIMAEFARDGLSKSPADDWGQSSLPDPSKSKRELQTLLHPEMLGRAFQVLVLAKNIAPGSHQLAGFKFAPESNNFFR
jgi:SAM-dependent MidA family methyltransferase